jgi:hypothetical protein
VHKTVSSIAVAALTASLALTAGAVAKLPGGARFSGKTEAGMDVALRVSRNAKSVARIRIFYHVTCDNGGEGDTYTDISNVPLSSRGRFSGKGSYVGSSDHSTNRFEIRGRVGSKRATGTFSLTAKGESQSTLTPVRCKSGDVTWTATRTR